MPQRAEELIQGSIYHVLNKSIAGFIIFNNDYEYERMLNAIKYYRREKINYGLSTYFKMSDSEAVFAENLLALTQEQKLVEVIAYCLMPTHIHLILKQLKPDGIRKFTARTLSSYSHYFNCKYKRKGPLWQSRFKAVPVESDEQLLHLTRYLHLNPVTAHLAEQPEEWTASSYMEYIESDSKSHENQFCRWSDHLEIDPINYKQFVHEQIDTQRELASIKNMLNK